MKYFEIFEASLDCLRPGREKAQEGDVGFREVPASTLVLSSGALTKLIRKQECVLASRLRCFCIQNWLVQPTGAGGEPLWLIRSVWGRIKWFLKVGFLLCFQFLLSTL